MYFHIPLHAMRKDVILGRSHIAALIIFVATTLFVAQISIYYSVPIALILANFSILWIKYHAYRSAVQDFLTT